MLSIRHATVEDVSLLKIMIAEFAEFERLGHKLQVTEEGLARDGFGPQPAFQALIAQWNDQAAGYALFFPVYSTFAGRTALFLEDIYVRAAFRGKGIGNALMARVAGIARERGCFGVRWEVLDWNQPAIDFYKKLGAQFMDEWKAMYLWGDAFHQLAEAAA